MERQTGTACFLAPQLVSCHVAYPQRCCPVIGGCRGLIANIRGIHPPSCSYLHSHHLSLAVAYKAYLLQGKVCFPLTTHTCSCLIFFFLYAVVGAKVDAPGNCSNGIASDQLLTLWPALYVPFQTSPFPCLATSDDLTIICFFFLDLWGYFFQSFFFCSNQQTK